MSTSKQLRVEKLQRLMQKEDLSAIICRLPENVVYITDYWPHHGISVALLPREGKPVLFVPEVEQEYTQPEWAEVVPFGWGLLKDKDLYENYRELIASKAAAWGLKGKKVGAELSFEVVAPSYRIAEPVVPSGPWQSLLHTLFEDASLVDATPLLLQSRAVKTEYEIEKLRIANNIAELGINEALSNLKPGQTEAEIGALIEYTIRAKGPGYQGAKLVRAEAEVGAGPIGSTKGTLLVPSTTYRVQEGDLVMIELATMVDGYFSDLTYMAVVGEPTARQKEVYNVLLEAQQAAARELRAGNSFEAPDRAAREVLRKAGLEEYFVHITGHGVGLRYHEFVPVLAPGAQGTLEEGMVCSVEPGIYIPNFGGLRIEDNVVVGTTGPIFLSTPRKPW
ncbi:Xaa-Pro peptidase family protein [Thermanaerothrix sp.]|jgi:Xaa-Pro dipeptidase|uniref:Xaa-Pro peptidase family protein n=1 Tax=Thermanaerothrix sp. TaxID=2972675 RepID=UPI002ADDC948|nr:Xaa-Pro peptidase family protein [Thermanaerothrix sp.]